MRRKGPVLVCVFIGLAWCAAAPADEKSDALVRSIVEEWRSRQHQVQTLDCTAEVENFYPRGYLSELCRPSREGAGLPALPDLPNQDKRFNNEPFACKLDFVSKRARREFSFTLPYITPDTCELQTHSELQLFAGGKGRVFRRKKTELKPDKPNVVHQDVTLYESGPPAFMFSLIDLPLLWLAGDINGESASPVNMTLLEDAGRFTYRGEAQWQGRDCTVLTVQDQQSPPVSLSFGLVGKSLSRSIAGASAMATRFMVRSRLATKTKTISSSRPIGYVQITTTQGSCSREELFLCEK